MLVLDKIRALDRMVWLSQAHQNAVPPEFLRPAAPIAWSIDPAGRRVLTAAVVLGAGALVPVASPEPEPDALLAMSTVPKPPLVMRHLAPVPNP